MDMERDQSPITTPNGFARGWSWFAGNFGAHMASAGGAMAAVVLVLFMLPSPSPTKPSLAKSERADIGAVQNLASIGGANVIGAPPPASNAPTGSIAATNPVSSGTPSPTILAPNSTPTGSTQRIEVAQSDRCRSDQRWNGERCVRRVTLLPLPKDGCQRGYWRTEGHCCPLSKAWTGERCATQTNAQGRPDCPLGTSGAYPDCVADASTRCPVGTRFRDGACVQRDEAANDGECDRGFYSSEGHCCPRGTIWNGKRCLRNAGFQPSCPRGQIGVFPDCKEPGAFAGQKCPSGTTGVFPNCVQTGNCPPGLTGAPPNCRQIQVTTCPAGTRGRYPDCVPIARVCPPGMTGVPPVCRRQGRTVCPPGTVGSAGRCIVLQPPRAPIQPRPIVSPRTTR